MLAFLFSSPLYAFDCPPAGGHYALSGHDANGTHCTYTSDNAFKLDLQGTKLVKPKCPPPIITDPHYQLVECHHDAIKAKCICTTVRRQ